ncbi:allantoicase and ureidoglycolate lyase domain-containing protein [Phanerochaete sordida]|uniref:Allantoicase and ureidoglycolate lyase domain-containing protein n=1 Tax=Phanerochaete sordida TaxID=48140 RepID=A0A9P3GCK4_9APHY|nr:allantoicase and ureidoglycolate lyase domain-containing protein [Phanerochaete sordida]
MTAEQIPLEDFAKHFATAIELSSVALGGQVCSVSDEFFAEAHHLLLVEPAPSLKGQFGPKGALFSGWETRRHNPAHDWCIIRLGSPGAIFGFDVDTSHFNGNEAPAVSVDALYHAGDQPPSEGDGRWREVLPRVPLGPSARHLFKVPQTAGANYVKLNMYPDGGIARFRVYGLVEPVFPSDPRAQLDLAHVFAGGRVVFTSDQHFGVGANLILPGRGKDMGDGWETKRSRQPGHKDWAVIKLGDAGFLSHVEIDTAHFMGNFPESCEVHAVFSTDTVPSGLAEDAWTAILPRTKLGPHRQHQFALANVEQPYTHVRVTIHPDGGIKRVRVIGRRATGGEGVAAREAPPAEAAPAAAGAEPARAPPRAPRVLPALALTPEAFAPFGQVVQAYADVHAVPAPRTTRITGANQGTATKFHKLALLDHAYPPAAGATTGLSVYRCRPVALAPGGLWEVKLLERHPTTKQAFVPMGEAAGADALPSLGKRYLVIVAQNGADDKPDLQTMRAFVASAGQGIMYDMGIWHHPMAVLDGPMDFSCVETQIGDGNALDCEVVSVVEGGAAGYAVEVST